MPDDADEPAPVSGGGLRPGGRQVLRVRVGRGQPGGDRVRRGRVQGLAVGAAGGDRGGLLHQARRAVRGAGPDGRRRRRARRHVPVGHQGVRDPRGAPAQGLAGKSVRLGRQTGQNGIYAHSCYFGGVVKDERKNLGRSENVFFQK